MNKKFLSAILFGALMVTSTGTFVSCKDYDDEIDNLQGQIDANSSAIAELKSLVQSSDYVTSVTVSGQNLVVTTKNGGAKTLALPTCDVEAGTMAEIKNNELYLDGTATGIKVAEGEAVKVVDGEWAIQQADGSYKSTGIPASGVTVEGDEANGYILTVVDAEGEETIIELPTAASSLIDLMVVDGKNALSFADYKYEGQVEIADWKGPRALPVGKGKTANIIASVESPIIQINPTAVDGEEIEFKLVDSKNNYPTNVTLTASPYTELLKVASKAANANGLYSLSLNETVVADEDDYKDFLEQFEDVLYAVTAGGKVRSEYKVVVADGKEATLSTIAVTDANGDVVKASNGNDCEIFVGGNLAGTVNKPDIKVAANEWYSVVADDAEALYDMHLSVSDDDKTLFGVEFDEEVGSYKFRLTATPDNITKAGFKLNIETISMTGVHKTAYLWIGQNSIIAEGVAYDAIEHEMKTIASDKNFFSISLDKMKNSLGTAGLALWNKSVADKVVTYLDADGKPVENATGINLVFVEELKAKVSENVASDISKATNLVFNVTKAAAPYFKPNKQYTAVIEFVNADGEELNSISVPFTFTLPAISNYFEIDPGFVKEGVTHLYLYEDDSDAIHTSETSATFMLDRVFSKYEPDYTISLEDETEVGETEKTSAELAHLNSQVSDTKTATSVTIKANTLAYVTLNGKLGEEAGYGQVLNFSISGKFDGAWEYPEGETFDFQAKILSPIKEGKITPKDGTAVTIKASDLNGFKFGNSLIVGQTYNSEVTYKVLQDMEGDWSRTDIASVNAKSGNENYFKVKETKNGEAGSTEGTVVEGYFLLEGYNVDHTVETTLTVEVTDIWQRTISSEIPVKITVAE